MSKLKKKNRIILKNQIVNSFMRDGKKHTGEKILLKLSKLLQKSTKKNFQSLVQLSIINLVPAFKLNEQTMKKGKRKSKKITLSFIIKDSLRVMTALKSIKYAAQKSKNAISFHESLTEEVLDASLMKGGAIDHKIRFQNQVLLNKRYLAKFKW